jgi:hypothetical protein
VRARVRDGSSGGSSEGPSDGAGRLALPGLSVGPGWIVTARSYFADRVVPACETIRCPPVSLPEATLAYALGPATLPARPMGRLRRRLARLRPAAAPHAVPAGRIAIDLRRHAPENWAHFLNNHLPLTFRLAEALGLSPEQARARLLGVVPEAAPGYLRGAAALFGLELLATDGAVAAGGGSGGEVLSFSIEPWHAQRAARHLWVRAPWPRGALGRLAAEAPGAPLPRRILLSRRDTRRLSNLAEVEAVLAPRGYATVHAEDFSPADQMRLICGAEEVAAVHGAGLAPLLYAGLADGLPGPRRLIELMPCGHMTDVYRVMAAQVGCAWIGVRGRIKPEYVRPAYDLAAPFRAHSLDDFEIDPEALRLAFDLIAQDPT